MCVCVCQVPLLGGGAAECASSLLFPFLVGLGAESAFARMSWGGANDAPQMTSWKSDSARGSHVRPFRNVMMI